MTNSEAMKEEESRWEGVTGLSITNVLNHYQVIHTGEDGLTVIFSSSQRHECRAFIRGYIKGNLDALKTEVDREIESDKKKEAWPGAKPDENDFSPETP